MKESLAVALVDQNVLAPQVEVDVRYTSTGLSGCLDTRVNGTFIIKEIEKKNGSPLKFHCLSIRAGEPLIVLSNHIVAIDGMDPVRIAEVYNIRADGSTKRRGNKRGRKPRSVFDDDTDDCLNEDMLED